MNDESKLTNKKTFREKIEEFKSKEDPIALTIFGAIFFIVGATFLIVGINVIITAMLGHPSEITSTVNGVKTISSSVESNVTFGAFFALLALPFFTTGAIILKWFLVKAINAAKDRIRNKD